MTTAIERLQAQSDRQRVERWLNSIGETDQACRDEVLEQCKADLAARAYYVAMYEQLEQCAKV